MTHLCKDSDRGRSPEPNLIVGRNPRADKCDWQLCKANTMETNSKHDSWSSLKLTCSFIQNNPDRFQPDKGFALQKMLVVPFLFLFFKSACFTSSKHLSTTTDKQPPSPSVSLGALYHKLIDKCTNTHKEKHLHNMWSTPAYLTPSCTPPWLLPPVPRAAEINGLMSAKHTDRDNDELHIY